ncbi:L-serine ammonia-lyase, iron-sulfur-dependent, subunit alpha [Fundidesulfovibrio butyratiphilus]
MGLSIKDILHNNARQILLLETDPGLGCTEPAAIGLCAAVAAALLKPGEIDSVTVETDPNIYKNAMGVIIPHSGFSAGVALAAAMGAVAGDPAKKLEVFSGVEPRGLEKARELLHQGKATATIATGATGLYVKATVVSGGRTATAVVSGCHDTITYRSVDGQELPCDAASERKTGDQLLPELQEWLLGMTITELTYLLDEMDASDIRYVREGIDLNLALVEYGLSRGPGIAVGRTQLSLMRRGLLKEDMALWASIRTAAGIDSRMGGVPLPAMTLAGSGNQCIAAGVPVVSVARYATLEDESLTMKAVMLSYLVTCCIKAGVGRLSCLCGSGVAAGAGVAAATAYLLGGSAEAVGGAVKNHIACFTPVCCDGAKTSCALKVAELAGSAVKNGLLAISGCVVRATDGIVDQSPEQTMRNLGKVVREGLTGLDPAVLDVMLNKKYAAQTLL